MSEHHERLAKVLARRGVASRRAAERMIEAGEVQVNGCAVAHPGTPVDPNVDRILVNGRPLPGLPAPLYYLLHKPRGVITGRDDPEGRRSVLDLVSGLPHRVEPVGRLDMDTSGALMLTNDGALAHALTHPRKRVPKRYRVKIWKAPPARRLDNLRRGIMLDGKRTAPCKLRILDATDTGNTWIEITVTEGRNRLIRRMFEQIGHPVSKLRRESFATISLRGLEPGQLRRLDGREVERLRDISAGVEPERAGKSRRYGKGHARPSSPKPRKPRGARRSHKPGRKKPGRRKAGDRGAGGRGTRGKGTGGRKPGRG